MAKVTGNYEAIVVFSTAAGEEQVTTLNEKVRNLISTNATITSEDDWGKRRLAYPINDENEGHYYLVEFTSNPDFPIELERVINITEGILRYMVVSKNED